MDEHRQHADSANITRTQILAALNSEQVRVFLSSQLQQSFNTLGIEYARSKIVIAELIEEVRKAETIAFAERRIKSLFHRFQLEERITNGLKERAGLIYEQIAKYIIGPCVLDIGCGDGTVAQLIASDGHTVDLTDIVNYVDPHVNLPFLETTEGESLPYRSDCYDTVLLLTVLHHANCPLQVLGEAVRLSRRRIIVIESVCGVNPCDIPQGDTQALGFANLGDDQASFLSVIDWFYNRILHTGVQVPCKFNSPERWKLIFEDFGLREILVRHLGIDQALVPEYHSLHVLEKS